MVGEKALNLSRGTYRLTQGTQVMALHEEVAKARMGDRSGLPHILPSTYVSLAKMMLVIFNTNCPGNPTVAVCRLLLSRTMLVMTTEKP